MTSLPHLPIILAGGLGTRLATFVPGLPKTLAPVGGRPFVTYLLDRLVDAGFSEAVMSVGHFAEQVEATLGTRHRNLHLRYVRERELRGTGGALRLVMDHVNAAHCLVLNGDSYCHIDLADFLQWHAQRTEPVGLALVEVADVERYGRVELDASGRIVQFQEKSEYSGQGWINAGIYSVPSRLLWALPPEQTISLEREVFPRWLITGMAGYQTGGAFIDIGTPESYRAAEAFFAASPATPLS